jgi:hypothetical protein
MKFLAKGHDGATGSLYGKRYVNVFGFRTGTDESLVHQLQENVHPLKHSLNLQNLDGVLQVREIDLKKLVSLGIAIKVG